MLLVGRKRRQAKTRDYALHMTGEPGSDILVALSGRLTLENARRLDEELQAGWSRWRPAALTLDLSGVEYLDSAGAMVLLAFVHSGAKGGIPAQLAGARPQVQGILDLIDIQVLDKPPLRPEWRPPGLLTQLGAGFLSFGRDLQELMVFVGDLLFALCRSLSHPRSIRWAEVVLNMKRGGMEGLPILGLMSLLLGMVIAFMSSLQLQQLGATVYVAALVGVAMVKELGPLLTAILVAGRSGSAFAAEIGTMQVNEEVDALVIMGFEPLRFLAVPKVLAAMVVVPILSVYAIFFGIVGGLCIGVTLLDITVYTFITETYRVMNIFDIVSSLFKSLVFGLVVAGIGCQRGFKVRGGAQEVGVQTTSAVVASLFLIIVIDAAFAVVLHYIR